jgi:hypothetical protein
MHTTRDVTRERVITVQRMQIELERAGTRIAMSTTETDEETPAGVPLAFESRTTLSGTETRVHGTVRNGRAEVHSNVAGAKQTKTVPWPEGALLAEGLRLAEERAGVAAGTQYTNLAFQPDTLEAVAIDSKVGETASVELPDGSRTLTRIDQIVHLPGAPTRSVAWIDDEQNVAKLEMPVMGYELTLLACSQECAQAPNQGADILVHALVPAPRAISAEERQHGLQLRMSASDGGEELRFVQTDEQSVAVAGSSVDLKIAPVDGAAPSREGTPDAADLRANDWLQSNAREIRELARQGAGDARGAHEQMQRLEDFVRAFIRTKDLNVGYASALEVARKPEGDCTEHAVLLAALGRARGIPTRVVDGIVYVESYAGHEHVFVPHAWVQAYVDGRWMSFDAALHGFDAGHIALSYGDGDPWRFFAGFNALGRMRIESVAAVP